MPSKKGQEQAISWLKNKVKSENTLDSINAELCLNVIYDLQRQYDRLGAQFGHLSSNLKKERDTKEEQLSFLENDQ